jgi:hypothetical protein
MCISSYYYRTEHIYWWRLRNSLIEGGMEQRRRDSGKSLENVH